MEGVFKIESEEAFEKLLEHFDAASKEPVDWKNIFTIPPNCDERVDVRVNFETCRGDKRCPQYLCPYWPPGADAGIKSLSKPCEDCKFLWPES